MHQTLFGCVKSIAGTSFIALGSYVAYGNLSHLRSAIRAEGPGVSLMLTASRILHAYGADRQCFVQVFLLHMASFFWPPLLAMTGTVLLREFFTNNVNGLPKKDYGRVDLSASGSTSE